MKWLGQLLLLSGVAVAVAGTLTVYVSLRIFTNCALNTACSVNSLVYIQYLNTQTYGNTLTLYGTVLLVLGAVFFTAAQSKISIQKSEVPVAVAEAA